MSQPNNREGSVPPPGAIDEKLGEFWVENPWQIAAYGHNLSSFERNRVFLNVAGRDFLEVSHLTSADSDGDGRGAIAADFRGVGTLDLLVRQAGGGTLLLYENRMPARNYLQVSLRGRNGNRAGIGARLTAVAGGLRQVREMYPANSFFTQAPNVVHFGLGDATAVESLTIRWPSGKVQELKNIKSGQHLVVEEAQ